MQSPERREFQSDFAKKYTALGEEKGKIEGKIEGILAVLEVRGKSLTDEQRARILGSKNLEELENWLLLAKKAESADELFE